MSRHILAIDQGTSSTRCIIYDENGQKVATFNQEFACSHPTPDQTEQDPDVLLDTVQKCVEESLKEANLTGKDIKAVGITNQRETTIAWDTKTGKALANAIVWLDLRNAKLVEEFQQKAGGNADHLRDKCGLPFSTYFSATKMAWLIRNDSKVSDAIKEKRCAFGTVDSWLIYNLTGKKVFATDVSNASRTMLMNLKTCNWDPSLCEFFGIPMETLPVIRSSAEIYGEIEEGPLKGVPIAGVLGDQQAALLGQFCLKPGEAKNTYGTGCFMLFNTGEEPVESKHGLLTTVAYKLGKNAPTIYALEGSIAVAGAGLKWLRDRLGIVKDFKDVDQEASRAADTGDVYFVPAFSGLFAPHWRDDARGTIVGLTHNSQPTHIIRALLEAICFQTRDIAVAMEKDSKKKLKELKVDGGLSNSEVLLQTQADFLDIPVVKPSDVEATAFGSAFAAGIAVGLYSFEFRKKQKSDSNIYKSEISSEEREKRIHKWEMAIQRSFGWAPKTGSEDSKGEVKNDITSTLFNPLFHVAAALTVAAAVWYKLKSE